MSRPPKLVVRAYAPTRRALLGTAAGVLGLLLLYASFEYGRYRGGYDVVGASLAQRELSGAADRLTDINAGLRGKAAELETLQASQARERAEVSRTIGELQAQVARQTQELAFYKGLVEQSSATAASAPEVKIQKLRISRGTKPSTYVVRIMLAQPGTPQNQVSGTILLSVGGQSGDRPDTLDLARLTDGRQTELPFTLRFFANLEQIVTLPAGFRPQRLQVEVRSSRRGISPLLQSLIWTPDAN